MRFIILRNHEETLKHSSLLSIKTTVGELIFILDCRYRYTEAFKIAHARKTCLCLTEVSSMTTCQFNNLSSLCTANFSEGKRRLCTCYHFSICSKTHIYPISIAQKGKTFYYFRQDRSSLSWKECRFTLLLTIVQWPDHISVQGLDGFYMGFHGTLALKMS